MNEEQLDLVLAAIASDDPLELQRRLPAAVGVDDRVLEGDRTLLHAAAAANASRCVIWLLSRGASVGAADAAGRTATHHAAWHGAKKAALILVDHGAELYARDSEGLTVATTALTSREVLDNQEFASTLLKRANVDQDEEVAALMGNYERLGAIIANDPDVIRKNPRALALVENVLTLIDVALMDDEATLESDRVQRFCRVYELMMANGVLDSGRELWKVLDVAVQVRRAPELALSLLALGVAPRLGEDSTVDLARRAGADETVIQALQEAERKGRSN